MTGPLKNALAPKKVVRATGVEPITFGFGDRMDFAFCLVFIGFLMVLA